MNASQLDHATTGLVPVTWEDQLACGVFRVALNARLISPAAVVAWSDRQLAMRAPVPAWLMELSLASAGVFQRLTLDREFPTPLVAPRDVFAMAMALLELRHDVLKWTPRTFVDLLHEVRFQCGLSQWRDLEFDDFCWIYGLGEWDDIDDVCWITQLSDLDELGSWALSTEREARVLARVYETLRSRPVPRILHGVVLSR
jgi:hypothetical protein